MSQTLEESYDDIAYHAQGYSQSHPDRLATLARLHGLDAPPVETARVLEIGCAEGGNIGPMGYSLPDARFVGVDLSAKQIEEGKRALERAGITNVDLRHGDVMKLGDSLGKFDYVVAHGVFSWVPLAVADEVLALCARSLTPKGVAFISHNTLPGFYGRVVLRELALFHARTATALRERVGLARKAMVWLRDALPEGGPYGGPMGVEVTSMAKESDWYVAHEHLTEHNRAVYFSDFVAQAAKHGLAYLDDAGPEINAEYGTTPDAASARAMGGSDVVAGEQYFDFLKSRTFRRTLLCHAAAEIVRVPPPDAVERLFVGSRFRPAAFAEADLRRRAPLKLHSEKSEMTSDHPLTKAALVHLAGVAPRAIPFLELLEAARARIGETSDRDVQLLRRFLVRTFLSVGPIAIDLRTFQPPVVTRAGPKPMVCAWGRDEVRRFARVMNMRHEGVVLDDTLRLLVPLLDGTRDTTELTAAWAAARGRPFAAGSIEAALEMLARNALLIA